MWNDAESGLRFACDKAGKGIEISADMKYQEGYIKFIQPLPKNGKAENTRLNKQLGSLLLASGEKQGGGVSKKHRQLKLAMPFSGPMSGMEATPPSYVHCRAKGPCTAAVSMTRATSPSCLGGAAVRVASVSVGIALSAR